MNKIPHELALSGVYMPPSIVAFVIGVILAITVAKLLNRYKMSNYLYYPPIVFMALVVIFTVIAEQVIFLF